MLADPRSLLADAPEVAGLLRDAGWSTPAVHELLGPHLHEHLDRGELAPLLRRTTGSSLLTRLTRALVLGTEVGPGTLPPSWVGRDGRALVRLQPVQHGGTDVTVPHDPGDRATPVSAEQVLGVGAASLTLAGATPREPVGRVLDLGCGSGVQALLAAPHAEAVVATDRNDRALALTELAAVLNGTVIETRRGDLLEPVDGDLFDLVVSNPPFVISPVPRYTYRDAGLPGDALSEQLVRRVPELLPPGGHAVLLANWLHLAGEDGDARVRNWVEGSGCDGWVVQRELAAPEEYVTAWLRDTDEAAFDDRYDGWLDALEGVDAIAFGIVALHRPESGSPTGCVLEHVDQPTAPEWGEEVVGHFRRRHLGRLADADLLAVPLRLRADVRLEQVATRGDEGWEVRGQVLRQDLGLRRSGGVDGFGATLLAACDGRTPLGSLVQLLAGASGLAVDEAVEQLLPAVRALVEQGFLEG